MKKKLSLVLFGMIFALSLSACGGAAPQAGASEGGAKPEEPAASEAAAVGADRAARTGTDRAAFR